MKITRVSSLVVNANMRNWIFVKVETDQAGLYGWGDRGCESAADRRGPAADRAPVPDHVSPVLLEGRHRGHERDQRNRAGAVGYQGQVAERAGVRAAGWSGARLRARIQPPRRRADEEHVREQRAAG